MGTLTTLAPKSGAAGQQQYLTFMLNGEMFATAILNVKEIIDYSKPTVVPLMPDYMRGVINLRGSVVPVVDLSRRFDGPPTPISRRTCIVIMEIESDSDLHELGIVVDAVNEVLEIRADQIEPPPAFGTNIRASFLEGMGKVDGRFVIIFNAAKVLSLEDLAAAAQAAPEAMPAL